MRQGAAVSGVVRNLSGRPVEGATVHWCYLGREEIVLPSTFARVEGCKKQRPECAIGPSWLSGTWRAVR